MVLANAVVTTVKHVNRMTIRMTVQHIQRCKLVAIGAQYILYVRHK